MVKIHLSNQNLLPRKFTFVDFSKKTYMMGTHEKCLCDLEISKNIHLIIWILFLARATDCVLLFIRAQLFKASLA